MSRIPTRCSQRKISQFFRILQETCAHKTPTKHRQRKQTSQAYSIFQYFCSYQQVVPTQYFILYPLFILLPHYLQQLNFYTSSNGNDTDAVAAIAIPCLFLQVLHRHQKSCRHQYCIQYSGSEPLSFSAVPWRDIKTEPLFGARRCHYSGSGSPQ